MKTAQELLNIENGDAKLDKEATKLANSLIDRLAERKSESINCEDVSVTEVLKFGYGTYKHAESLVNRTASILVDHGYYVQTGWCETTPNGNERPMIKVSLTKPKYSHKLDIIIIISVIVSILLTILFYLSC